MLWNTPWMFLSISGILRRQLEQRWEHGGKSWHGVPCPTQQGDKWSLSDNIVKTAMEFYIVWLSAQALCIFSYWFDFTFYDILSLEMIHLLTTWEMTVLGRDREEEEDRERLRWNWIVRLIHWWMFLFLSALTTN